MPGELGDEETQQGVGYYERRYVQTGEWNDPPPDKKNKPRSSMIMSVLKKFEKDR
jgi:hypothetical protein